MAVKYGLGVDLNGLNAWNREIKKGKYSVLLPFLSLADMWDTKYNLWRFDVCCEFQRWAPREHKACSKSRAELAKVGRMSWDVSTFSLTLGVSVATLPPIFSPPPANSTSSLPNTRKYSQIFPKAHIFIKLNRCRLQPGPSLDLPLFRD